MLLLLIGLIGALPQGEPSQAEAARQIVTLPPPRERGPLSVEEALRLRRSVRTFAGGPLTQTELSQLLWTAQGITSASAVAQVLGLPATERPLGLMPLGRMP